MIFNTHLQSPYINSRRARLKDACMRCTTEMYVWVHEWGKYASILAIIDNQEPERCTYEVHD